MAVILLPTSPRMLQVVSASPTPKKGMFLKHCLRNCREARNCRKSRDRSTTCCQNNLITFPPDKKIGERPPQRFVNRAPHPTPPYEHPQKYPPVKKGSEIADPRGGVGLRPTPRRGMGMRPTRGNVREDDWPADQRTHPLEEQEEVRDLKFEDQVRGEEFGNLEEERADVNQGEKFDYLEQEEEEGEEEEEGGAQEAFDPEEIEEVRKKEELEDQRYEEGVAANINRENLPQPKESREGGVIDIPPQGAKDPGPVPVPGLNQDENLDGKYDDYDKKYDAKDPVPVPGLNQDQNLDRKYDDYDKKYEEEEDEDDYVYKDSKDEDKDKKAPDELPRGLDEQQRIMIRRDIEGQQQKLVSEHDAHKREEPDFPELVKVVNRVNKHKEIR